MRIGLVHPRKAAAGDKVAVLSPSFAAPGFAPEVHEQAMERLTKITGLVPVEYPTTRRLHASAHDRAADFNAAFADPEIRAVLATIGGEDQITVVPHLDPEIVRTDPKLFLGYSDNTNVLNSLWNHGVAGFYGGSTQVHLGPGPAVDEVHVQSLRAALLEGGHLQITEPGESEDIGRDWKDPAALTEYGDRRAYRTVDLGRAGNISDRPRLGRVCRGTPVGPDSRTLSGRPVGSAGRGPAAGDLRGTHPGPRVRLDPPLARRTWGHRGRGRGSGGPPAYLKFRGAPRSTATRRPPGGAARHGRRDRATVQPRGRRTFPHPPPTR